MYIDIPDSSIDSNEQHGFPSIDIQAKTQEMKQTEC